MFNGAVPGGDLEEAMCVYELACECGRRPKRILLEVHGWSYMLGERRVSPPADFGPIFQRLLKRLKFAENDDEPTSSLALLVRPADLASGAPFDHGWFDPYDKLISPRYMQLGLQVLARRYLQQDHSAGRGIPEDKQNLLYPDGSVEWSPSFRSATPDSIRQRIRGRIIRAAELEDTRPDEARCRLFEAFLLEVLRSGTQVDLLLTPPIHWQHESARAEYRALGRETPAGQTEKYLTALAQKRNLRVFGAFDQRQTELTDADYVDAIHIRRESVGKLLHTRRK
jgi:hypothetical protein